MCESISPAINCRSCGNVSAGVSFFSPSRLLVEEPRGEQRQGLVMMPGDPVPHLIVPQAGFAFSQRDNSVSVAYAALRHPE